MRFGSALCIIVRELKREAWASLRLAHARSHLRSHKAFAGRPTSDEAAKDGAAAAAIARLVCVRCFPFTAAALYRAANLASSADVLAAPPHLADTFSCIPAYHLKVRLFRSKRYQL